MSYEVSIDGCAENLTVHAAQNPSGHLMFSTKNLAYKDHTVNITNLGPKRRGKGSDLLVDFLKTTVDIAPAGCVSLTSNDGVYVE